MKKVALIFPGQGSQAMGMGREFYDQFPLARAMFDEASERLSFEMKHLLFDANEKLQQTAYTQPAILLVSAIAARLLREEVELDIAWVAGHSLGEFSSLVAAGALTFSDALSMVHQRGELMQNVCKGLDTGMMVVLGVEDSVLEMFCTAKREEGFLVWPANYNGDGQIVLAGKRADLLTLEESIKRLGAKRALMLPMSVASHCPLLDGMRGVFGDLLSGMLSEPFFCPVISNVTAQPYATKSEGLHLLASQLTSPVLYKQSIQNHEASVDLFLECGHGSVLKGLNKRLSTKPTYSIENPKALQEFILAYEAHA